MYPTELSIKFQSEPLIQLIQLIQLIGGLDFGMETMTFRQWNHLPRASKYQNKNFSPCRLFILKANSYLSRY